MKHEASNPEVSKPIREGVNVIATFKGMVLMGQRLKEPNYGKWVLPGGGMENDETYEQTAIREIMEETGVEITNIRYLTQTDVEEPDILRRIHTMQAEIVAPEHIKGTSDLGNPGLINKNGLLSLDISDVVRPILIETGWL